MVLSSWNHYGITIKDFTLGDYLFGAFGYGIGFDACSKFVLLAGEWDKNVVIFGVDNISSTHTDNRKKLTTEV